MPFPSAIAVPRLLVVERPQVSSPESLPVDEKPGEESQTGRSLGGHGGRTESPLIGVACSAGAP